MLRICVFAVLLALGFCPDASAQARQRRNPGENVPPHLLMERLNRMKPAERERLLSRMPAERRNLVERRLQKFAELPPEARDRLHSEYTRFQQLPPEKQDNLRKLFKQFSAIEQERQRHLRRELVRLRNMPSERRAQRMSSERFRTEYNESERKLLEDLTGILATPAAPEPEN